MAALGLGRVRLRQGRPAEAEPLLREAHASLREKRGAGYHETATAALLLAEAVPPARRREAAAVVAESLEAVRAARGADDLLARRLSRALARLS
jgi:hypothetical protein